MSSVPGSFRAFVVEQRDGGEVDRGARDVEGDLLEHGDGDVLVRVAWSGINYKDNLASSANGKVARISPLITGIDLAGTVAAAGGSGPAEGAEVLVHGYDTGVAHHGGYGEYASVPSAWVVPLPAGLSGREAMSLGTAGFTAALSVDRIEGHGVTPDDGPVLVTGASGGVGGFAVAILARRGFHVVASTGSAAAADWLGKLGASEIIGREDLGSPGKPLQKERWAAVVDSVGGETLAAALSAVRYGGAVAASGNAGGIAVPTTVLPFILRGVALLGIDSVQVPLDERIRLWERIADDLRPADIDALVDSETDLDGLDASLGRIARNEVRGRIVVRVGS
ncbi:MAG TPA: acryloyl-CoA reductase [Pseudonocardia sp.]|jgi:acrylyl-CoA reductase (NADPH)